MHARTPALLYILSSYPDFYDRNWRETLSFDGRRSHPLLSSKPGVQDFTNTARMFDGLSLTASGLVKTMVLTCPTSISGAVLICALFPFNHLIPKDNMMHCAPSCLAKDSVVAYVVWEAAWIFRIVTRISPHRTPEPIRLEHPCNPHYVARSSAYRAACKGLLLGCEVQCSSNGCRPS